MAYQSTYRCWQGMVKRARCKFCRRPVVWRISDEKKNLAFDPDAPVLRVDVHPEKLTKFDVLEATHLHSRTCPHRAERAAAARKKKREREGTTFAAQGRLL